MKIKHRWDLVVLPEKAIPIGSKLVYKIKRNAEGFQQGDENIVCLLKKSIYGLKQAARSWNNTLHEIILEAKFVQSLNDPCLYYGNIYGKEQINYIQNLGDIKQYLGIEISEEKRTFVS